MYGSSTLNLSFLNDQIPEAEPLPLEGWRNWCGGRMVTVLKAGSSVASLATSILVHWKNFHPVTNALSSVGIGLGAQALVSTFVPDIYTSRVQQISQSVFGQTSLFLVSQLIANFPVTQTAGLAAIGVMLGVNLALWGKQFIDNRLGLQSETVPLSAAPGAKFECFNFKIPARCHYPLKGILAAACFTAWFMGMNGNTLLQGIASFGACYYASEPVSQFFNGVVDRKIGDKTQRAANRSFKGLSTLLNSRWLVLKTVVNTFSYLAIPFVMVPWDKPRTTTRSLQLWAIGLFTGLFDGFLYRTQENELRKTNIDQIPALKPRIEVHNRFFRIFRIAYPILVFSSITAFVISQWASKKSDLSDMDKLSMGTMYLGYLYSTVKGAAIQRYWSLKDRVAKLNPTILDKIIDGRVVSQIIPRFMAINPIYIYYLLTNSIAMHSGQDVDNYHKALSCTAWFFYGKGMGTEFQQTMGENQGTIFRFPTMLFINSLLTTVPVLKGEVS